MSFPYIFVISLIGCVLGSLFTQPESDIVLMRFYMQIRPWGFWKPVVEKIHLYYPDFEPNRNFRRDALNVLVGVTWQTSLVILPIALVIKEYSLLTGALISVAVTSAILKFSWWNKLDEMSKETLPEDFDTKMPALLAPSETEAVKNIPAAVK
jgi:hypothetical protein